MGKERMMVLITQDIDIIDLALHLKEHQTLIFSDFHIGYEEMLNKQGILLPRFQWDDIVKRLELTFSRIKKNIKTIVINGDLKHEFGSISSQEWREILKLFDYFSTKAEDVIIVKGNHDVMLEPIARKRNIHLVEDHRVGNILIMHGDEIAGKEKLEGIETLIIGHDHPAIGIREHRRTETVKCFLKGKWKRRTIIAQPSFNPLIEGSDIFKEKMLSPYLQQLLNGFEVWIIPQPGEVLYFGKVQDSKKEEG